MALRGTTNEQKIWNYFKDAGFTDAGCAGMMGNLYAESGLNPMNLQDTYQTKLGYTDASYAAAVDKGIYKNFIRDSAGWGLAQWTYWSRKQALYNLAKERGDSIADLGMQLDFLIQEMNQSFAGLLLKLRTVESVQEASDCVLLQYEQPADCSNSVKQKRAAYAQKYYDKFVKVEEEEETPSEPEVPDTSTEFDNTPDLWANDAVKWAVRNKILFGDADGNYKLHEKCTRQELMIFLYRLYRMKK